MKVQIPKELSLRAVGMAVLIGANLGATLYLAKLTNDVANMKPGYDPVELTLFDQPAEEEAAP